MASFASAGLRFKLLVSLRSQGSPTRRILRSDNLDSGQSDRKRVRSLRTYTRPILGSGAARGQEPRGAFPNTGEEEGAIAQEERAAPRRTRPLQRRRQGPSRWRFDSRPLALGARPAKRATRPSEERSSKRGPGVQYGKHAFHVPIDSLGAGSNSLRTRSSLRRVREASSTTVRAFPGQARPAGRLGATEV